MRPYITRYGEPTTNRPTRKEPSQLITPRGVTGVSQVSQMHHHIFSQKMLFLNVAQFGLKRINPGYLSNRCKGGPTKTERSRLKLNTRLWKLNTGKSKLYTRLPIPNADFHKTEHGPWHTVHYTKYAKSRRFFFASLRSAICLYCSMKLLLLFHCYSAK